MARRVVDLVVAVVREPADRAVVRVDRAGRRGAGRVVRSADRVRVLRVALRLHRAASNSPDASAGAIQRPQNDKARPVAAELFLCTSARYRTRQVTCIRALQTARPGS